MERHSILADKVHLYRRGTGTSWHCAASVGGKERRKSTREESLALAKQVAEDWYLDLRGKLRRGDLDAPSVDLGPTFRQAAETFLKEYPVLTDGQRNAEYVRGHARRVNLHLLPFFGDTPLSQVTEAKVIEYRISRVSAVKFGRTTARQTLHQEIVVLRQILKTAKRHRWIDTLPDLSDPYPGSRKVCYRPWFPPEEYRILYRKSREWAKHPPQPRWANGYKDIHDQILIYANTGLRPDEGKRLKLRDVRIVDDEATGEKILDIDVRGKRGVGPCKSMPGAVRPFQRLCERHRLEPNDLIFRESHIRIFRALLDVTGLTFDRDGKRRVMYSLRHTYICMRLLEGADIYQLAKNCRTSVEMIQNHYAAHLKNTIDTAAVNVRKVKPTKPRPAYHVDDSK